MNETWSISSQGAAILFTIHHLTHILSLENVTNESTQTFEDRISQSFFEMDS